MKPADGTGWHASGLIAVAVMVVLVAIVYIVWHYYMYRNCIFAPDLLQWPSSCL
jgi:hypothetical protein